jgi:pyridoxamine 5'-phosphate oxidase
MNQLKMLSLNLHNYLKMHDKWGLSVENVSDSPFSQFNMWYREHLSEDTSIPEAVYLATASTDGRVSVRTVLLKDYGEKGFTFYTNYLSRKGIQLASNNHAALLFHWPEADRQVRIEGRVAKVPGDISDEYFSSRPRESQLAAWASAQSSVIPGRHYLEENYEDYRKLYSGTPVPRPGHWGGYIVIPDWFEFWQDRKNRLHDRIVYAREGERWKIQRLAP